jgi:hypothetical protein
MLHTRSPFLFIAVFRTGKDIKRLQLEFLIKTRIKQKLFYQS